MDTQLLNDLDIVLDYLWEDEQKDFLALGEPKDHIFNHILRLEAYHNKKTSL